MQIPTSLEDDIHVWNIKTNFNKDSILDYMNLLSDNEKKRASNFKFEKDSVVYITARGILRMLSSRYLKLNPQEIIFNYTEFGKPFFYNDTSVQFNVSHSGERIVIAFCQDYKVGVDIEKIKDCVDVLELAQNFFSKTEIKILEKQPKEELSKSFFRCWTRKESFIKAEGSGLSFPLDRFAVSMDADEHAKLLETDWDFSEKFNWNLYSFSPEEQYIGAIAIRKKQSRVQYFNWKTN